MYVYQLIKLTEQNKQQEKKQIGSKICDIIKLLRKGKRDKEYC